MGVPILYCEHLDVPLCRELLVTKEILDKLILSEIAIFSVFRSIIWLAANNEDINIYSYTPHNDLCLLDTIEVKSYIHGDTHALSFVSFCSSDCSMQAFLLYIQDGHEDDIEDKNSFVFVFDLKTLKIVSILEMELTMNRHPQLKMYPSRDGSKLFVQERFENRVILLPSIFFTTYKLFITEYCKTIYMEKLF